MDKRFDVLMNICIFGNSFLPMVGGKEYVMHYLANALVELGHNVTVVAERLGWSEMKEKHSYEVHRYSLPYRGMGRLGIDYISGIALFSYLHSQKKFDVINCHGVDYAGVIARTIKKLYKLPLIMTPHGYDIQKIHDIGYGIRLNAAWDRKVSMNLKAADYVTAISNSIRCDIDMIPEEKIVNISNGIHIKKFKLNESNYLRKMFEIDKNKKIVLSVGRNHIKKGYDYGIRAIAELVNNNWYKDLVYIIIGRTVSEHQKLIEELGVAQYVILLEEVTQDEIVKCYKSADIFFSPSIVEGLSLVSIEGMAAGLPLVVTNVPGNEDIVKENNCGLIVESKKPNSMAEGLKKLLLDDDLRKKLSSIALTRASEYDWLEIAKQYERLYIRAIQNHANSIS